MKRVPSVARLKVPSIMATLATQFFWYGVTLLIAGLQRTHSRCHHHDPHHSRWLPVQSLPVEALALGLTVFSWFILTGTG